MYCRIRALSWTGGILLPTPSLAALGLEAQIPDKFTNLQYFPKDVSRQQLLGTMRGFSFSLNVRCEFCHKGKGADNLEQLDFASDERDLRNCAGHGAGSRGVRDLPAAAIMELNVEVSVPPSHWSYSLLEKST